METTLKEHWTFRIYKNMHINFFFINNKQHFILIIIPKKSGSVDLANLLEKVLPLIFIFYSWISLFQILFSVL